MSKKRILIYVIFGFFFLFLILQYQLVYLQFDDFGYCSLSYGYDAGIDGTNMELKNVLDWFVHAYSFVNGRIFTNLVFVLNAWLGGLRLFRVFFPLCILGIFILIYSETAAKLKKEAEKIVFAILIVLSYGLFDIKICREGLYWYAAAFGYVLPILLFLVFIQEYKKKKKLQILLAFLLCMSSEQMVAMIFAFLFISIGLKLFQKEKIEKASFGAILAAIVGGCIMVLSPASQSRLVSAGNKAFYELKLFDKITLNINNIVKVFFVHSGKIFISFVLVMFVLVSLLIIREYHCKIMTCISICYAVLTMIIWRNSMRNQINLDEPNSCYFLFFYFMAGFVNLIVLYVKLDTKFISIIVSTMASLGLLLIVPEMPARTFIPFIFMCIYIMADMLSRFVNHGKLSLYMCLCVPYVVFMLVNIKTIYNGYEMNAEAFKYNDARLTEAQKILQEGGNVTEVELYRLVDDNYGAYQAYHTEVNFMKWWIDEYYSIPHNVVYIYYDYGTRNNAVSVTKQ